MRELQNSYSGRHSPLLHWNVPLGQLFLDKITLKFILSIKINVKFQDLTVLTLLILQTHNLTRLRHGGTVIYRHKWQLVRCMYHFVCIQMIRLDSLYQLHIHSHPNRRHSRVCDHIRNTSWYNVQSNGIGMYWPGSQCFQLGTHSWSHFDAHNHSVWLHYNTYSDQQADIDDQNHSSIPTKPVQRPNPLESGFL